MDGSNLQTTSPDQDALRNRYAALKAGIERKNRIEIGQAGALVFAADAFGEALKESTMLQRATHVAKLVCIAAVFIIPNLLVLHVLL